MAAVAVAASTLAACSSGTTEPFTQPTAPPGEAIAGRVVADDPGFPTGLAKRPRFVPCRGLSGCARTDPVIGAYYPGASLPAGVDDEVDYSVEMVVYLVGARFVAAGLARSTVHVEVEEREAGFQMVKLDGRDVFVLDEPRFRFAQRGRAICVVEPGEEGCG